MIFISHSTADDNFVNKLSDELNIRGIQTWVDHQDMEAGSRWVATLENALYQSELMLLILSKASIQSSYVEAEWHTYFNMGRKIIPLLIEACDVPLFLRTFHQIDFSHPELFENRVANLLGIISGTLEHTSAIYPIVDKDATLPTRPELEPQTLEHDEILQLAQDVLDEKAITLRARMMQFILPLHDVILQYPFVEEITIGRGQRNNQFCPSIDLSPYKSGGMVSRQHATFYVSNNTIHIVDDNSSNGTYIGDVALVPHEPYPLESYSLIYLSRYFPIMVRYQF